jgi:hypothetical protein
MLKNPTSTNKILRKQNSTTISSLTSLDSLLDVSFENSGGRIKVRLGDAQYIIKWSRCKGPCAPTPHAHTRDFSLYLHLQ